MSNRFAGQGPSEVESEASRAEIRPESSESAAELFASSGERSAEHFEDRSSENSEEASDASPADPSSPVVSSTEPSADPLADPLVDPFADPSLDPFTAPSALAGTEPDDLEEELKIEPAEETRQKSVGEYLAEGFSPDEVPGLNELSPVKLFQPLLRELLLGGADDFWMRLFVMRELLADQETSWSHDTLAVKFGWLAEEARRDIVRRMSRGGWLTFDEGRYSVTPLGEAAISITGMLGDLASKAGDLGLVVHSLKMAKEYGLDSRTQLDQLRHKLSAIGQEMERAYDSRSEHAILEAQKRLDGYLHWVETARQVLEKYELTTPQEHDRVRSAHDLLSRLHHWVSALQRALNDIGKRRIHLGDGGLTMRDITAFLARSDEDTLVALADGVLHLPLEQHFVIGDNMLSEAEYEICIRELPDDERRGWSEPASAESVEPELAVGGPIEDFVVDMRKEIAIGHTVPVSRFVSRESWATSAYRFTLLTLAGTASPEVEGAEDAEEQGPGRLLGSLPVDVDFDHRIWERVDGEFVSEMTSGKITPRPPAENAPTPAAPEEGREAGASDEGRQIA